MGDMSGDGPSAEVCGPEWEWRSYGQLLYEGWHGTHRFFLGGRIMTGPSPRGLLCSWAALTVPVLLYLGFVEPFVAGRTSYMSTVLAVVLICCSEYAFLRTGTVEPGICPPRAGSYSVDRDAYSTSKYPTKRPPRTQRFVVAGSPGLGVVRLKYCESCNIFQPPRTTHCMVCNVCIMRFDHHCPWMGTCIGRRNYRYFCGFMVSGTLLILLVITMCVIQLVLLSGEFAAGTHAANNFTAVGSQGDAFGLAIGQAPMALLLIIYSFFTSFFVVGLLIFHTYLSCTDQTTFEQIKSMGGNHGGDDALEAEQSGLTGRAGCSCCQRRKMRIWCRLFCDSNRSLVPSFRVPLRPRVPELPCPGPEGSEDNGKDNRNKGGGEAADGRRGMPSQGQQEKTTYLDEDGYMIAASSDLGQVINKGLPEFPDLPPPPPPPHPTAVSDVVVEEEGEAKSGDGDAESKGPQTADDHQPSKNRWTTEPAPPDATATAAASSTLELAVQTRPTSFSFSTEEVT